MIVKISTERGAMSIDIDNTRTDSSGDAYAICPLCSNGRQSSHQKEKKLAVNLIKEVWRCNHCGRSGGMFNGSTDKLFKGRVAYLSKQLPIDVVDTETEFLWKWFESERGISKVIATWLGIYVTIKSVRLKNVPPGSEAWIDQYFNQHVFAFPFLLDGAVVDCQYRDTWKNFTMESGADKIMYNIDSVKKKKKMIVTEGMIDVASIYTALGTETDWAVVSVPNGATVTPAEIEIFKKTGDVEIVNEVSLSYFTNCYELFKDIEEVCFAGDMDAAGIKLRKSIQRLLLADKTKSFSFIDWTKIAKFNGEKCKDANDVLKVDPKLIQSCIDRRTFTGEDQVKRALDVGPEIFSHFYNGLTKALKPQWGSFDHHFSMKTGDLIVGTGWPGSGKSTFTFNLAVIYSWLYGWKWGLWTPENYPISFVYGLLAEIVSGKSLDKRSDIAFTNTSLERSLQWVHDHFFAIDLDPRVTLSPMDIRKRIPRMLSMYNINGFIIDPWNSLIEDDTYYKLGGHKWLENQLTMHNMIAKEYGVTTIILVHPITQQSKERGGSDDGTFKHPTMYQIDGGKIWSAKADTVFTTHRPSAVRTNTSTEVYVQKLKVWKLYGIPTGEINPVVFNMDPSSNRFLLAGHFPVDSQLLFDGSVQSELEF